MVLFRIARVVSSILPIHGIQVVVCILQALYNLASIEDDLVSVGQADVQVTLVFVRRAFKPYKSNYRDGGLNVQGSGAHRTGRCRSGAGQVQVRCQTSCRLVRGTPSETGQCPSTGFLWGLALLLSVYGGMMMA